MEVARGMKMKFMVIPALAGILYLSLISVFTWIAPGFRIKSGMTLERKDDAF